VILRPYTVDLDLEVTVEVLSAERARRGGGWDPPEPASVELCVRLGTLDITAALPGDDLDALEADALERLADAAEP